ncbi:hypothetical protein SAMN04489721_3119 [Agromyces flavus]|uniref:Uncharacterized protein n=2 Tax=Agromyces flavus TaxID=589382 RepID=A0A1H1ZDH6_9MICO|nr:hypothetical protein SAMN04489721_3119 [Agromyces flavus]
MILPDRERSARGERLVNPARKGLTVLGGDRKRGRMHDSSGSVFPYVAGFALCVGAVFLLVACTTPAVGGGADAGARSDSVVVEQSAQ